MSKSCCLPELTGCAVCELPVTDCICCEACSHVCPRDQGETWCPVCFPEPARGE